MFHIIVESIVLLLDPFFNLYCRNALEQVRHISRYLYIWVLECLFVSRFLYRWSFSVNVQLSAGRCKILAAIVGPRLCVFVISAFFHLCFCRFVFFCAVLCREGGALAAPGDILAGICLPLGEKYPNTANNLKEM